MTTLRTAARVLPLCSLLACSGPPPAAPAAPAGDLPPAAAAAAPGTADLVLRGGNVITVDEVLGRAEAVAVCGAEIAAVGTDAEIDRWIGPGTAVLELYGRTVIPGFVEGHAHFTGIGDAAQILDLTVADSWDDIVAMVERAAAGAAPGSWIRGRGWHQEKWRERPPGAVAGFPVHAALSAVSPDHPVLLTHASGHAAICNAKALQLAGIGDDTADPAGGEILRDANGAATGVLVETAAGLVGQIRQGGDVRRSPAAAREALRRSLLLADAECARNGVTSFHDAGTSFATVTVMRELVDAGELHTRLYVMLRERNDRLAAGLAEHAGAGFGDERLTVRAVKRSIDGALGSRGAWLLEPYSDAPETAGLCTATVEDIAETARICAQHGLQLCVHAIGDRANREVLDLYEAVFAETGDGPARRWRIEHAQHLHPDDIPRFARLGVIASMQGVHCTSDAPWVEPRLGADRARSGAYVWRDLLDRGAVVTNGTDAPVEKVDPIASYHASVTRRTRGGDAFYPEQCMTRMEALRSYTVAGAFAAFEEDRKGTVTPGKLADLVVLSQDITEVPAERIPATEIEFTIVGGRVVYAR